MERITCSRIADFDGSTRKYYDVHDMRILDVNYNTNPSKVWHSHDRITEILFVLTGEIKVHIKKINIIEEEIIKQNEIIKFSPKEVHRVDPMMCITRILAIKYIQRDETLIPLIKSDWQDFT